MGSLAHPAVERSRRRVRFVILSRLVPLSEDTAEDVSNLFVFTSDSAVSPSVLTISSLEGFSLWMNPSEMEVNV